MPHSPNDGAPQPWGAAVGSALTLGLVVGIPYYSLPYYYDYFEHPARQGGFGWSRGGILLGLPLGTLVTLMAGPLLAHRVPLRTGVVAGSLVCAAAVAGFGWMNGSLQAYYGLWALYMAGWTLAGPMAHQVLLSRAFDRQRGAALALAFFGLSLFGALSVICLARPLTQAFGPQMALRLTGACMLLAAPVAWLTLPRGNATRAFAASPAPPDAAAAPQAPWRSRVFWLLLCGGTLTASGIAGISQHWKLILRERGFVHQAQLDGVYGWTVLIMLTGSALGRFAFGWCADRFPKRRVVTVAFLLMLSAIPLLLLVGRYPAAPYLFACWFGLGMSSDTLLVTLLAAERLHPAALGRAMGLLVPVNTVGQTWFPFALAILWGAAGSYTLPLIVVFFCILGGANLAVLHQGASCRIRVTPAPWRRATPTPGLSRHGLAGAREHRGADVFSFCTGDPAGRGGQLHAAADRRLFLYPGGPNFGLLH